jgi:metallo-beta-lactamase class B
VTRRRVLFSLLALLLLPAWWLFGKWREAGNNGGQQPADPFRIAGNLYYVGANDVTAYLLTGSDGHILIDGGYPGTAPMIIESIARLGFDIRDVKVLLNSEPHFDHAGGLAALQHASGAKLWASEASAGVLTSGGVDPDAWLPLRVLVRTGLLRFPPARVTRRFKDGDTLRLGSLAVVAHVTGGHTRGCTSYSVDVVDSTRTLRVVSACSLIVLAGMRYPEQLEDLERSVRVLKALPADIWVTAHARDWGRYRKYAASDTASDRLAPFLDREGYQAYLDSGAARFRRGVVQ